MGVLFRSKLFIAAVVLAVIVLAIGGFMVLKAMGKNNQAFATLEDRKKRLEGLLTQGVKNDAAINQQRERKEKLNEQLNDIKMELAKADEVLEAYFDDPRTGDKGPIDFGRWRVVYYEKMNELTRRLVESVETVTTATPIVVEQVDDKWREHEKLHPLEKRYWVQDAIVKCLAQANANKDSPMVPVFDSFKFLSAPERLLHPSHETLFTTIPFEIVVAMESRSVPEFLKILLDSPLKIELTSVSTTLRWDVGKHAMKGSDTTPSPAGVPAGAGMPAGRGGLVPGPGPGALGEMRGVPPGMGGAMGGVPTPGVGTASAEPTVAESEQLVTVTIRGYVPDYIQPKPAGQTAAAGAPGGT
jgi:hypothetical protein